jgi:5'-nucleotidase
MPKEPLILITNDDGIFAPGLKALKNALEPLGRVVVVAPDAERSASGHALTMVQTLRVAEVDLDGIPFGRAVNGTPADCVKLAINNLLEQKPDLVVSGINPGPNTGTNVLYSGTVSAAMEGVICGVPAMAMSMGVLKSCHDFSVAEEVARTFAEKILSNGLSDHLLLNINVPHVCKEEIKGVKITRQGIFRYRDKYELRQDPRGRDYYWLSLEDVHVLSPAADVDAVALRNGYISVTPIRNDLTAYDQLNSLEAWLA